MSKTFSLYIPHIEKHYNAEYVASIFRKNELGKVNEVFIEPCKSSNSHYNCAYITLDYWYETEAAYSFIKRLDNPRTEARLVHGDDNWWVVRRIINLAATEQEDVDDFSSTIAVGNIEDDDDIEDVEDFVIDIEKTNLLKNIITQFKKNKEEDDLIQYLDEIDLIRNSMPREITTIIADGNNLIIDCSIY